MEKEIDKEIEEEKVEKRSLYIVGDGARLIVKNFIKKFEEAADEWKIELLYPDPFNMNFDASFKDAHVIICLSEDMDFQVISKIASAQKKIGFYIYFIGTSISLGIEEEKYFNKIPSVRFSQYLFDIYSLLYFIDRNDLEKKHVLIVDDEPIMLRNIKTWLSDDFDVSVVNSGKAALKFLESQLVDLILLDYKMPEMSGPAFLTKIRGEEDFKNLPVIFLTASSDKESVLSVVHLKPEGYILKNKPSEEIKAAVKDFFKNRIINVE
jgi:CheY-like chemotaxis protein